MNAKGSSSSNAKSKGTDPKEIKATKAKTKDKFSNGITRETF